MGQKMKRTWALAIIALLVILIAATGTLQTGHAAGPSTYYVVRPGDTLFSIAARFGVSSWSLARANGVWDPNFIFVGQTLIIPGGYMPNPCPGCPFPYPQPVPRPIPGPIYRCSYQVQYGDTLTSIAARLGLNVWTLAQANGLYNVNWIYVGQWLRVPGCGTTPPSPLPPTVTPTATSPTMCTGGIAGLVLGLVSPTTALVTLKDPSGNILASTSAGSSGSFGFFPLPLSSYVVVLTVPDGYQAQSPTQVSVAVSQCMPTFANATFGLLSTTTPTFTPAPPTPTMTTTPLPTSTPTVTPTSTLVVVGTRTR
jgi:LysM repeat protein